MKDSSLGLLNSVLIGLCIAKELPIEISNCICKYACKKFIFIDPTQIKPEFQYAFNCIQDGRLTKEKLYQVLIKLSLYNGCLDLPSKPIRIKGLAYCLLEEYFHDSFDIVRNLSYKFLQHYSHINDDISCMCSIKPIRLQDLCHNIV